MTPDLMPPKPPPPAGEAGKTMIRRRSDEEKRTQNDILREFGSRTDMCLWRQNAGVASFNGRRVQFGVPGQADLSGILPDGRRLEVEVKSTFGRQRVKQQAFERMIRRLNGVYILARSIEDVYAALHEAGYSMSRTDAEGRSDSRV